MNNSSQNRTQLPLLCTRSKGNETLAMARQMVIIAFFAFLLNLSSHAQSWRGLSPVTSGRSDLEKALSVVGSEKLDHERYFLDEAIVDVLYADGKCDGTYEVEWNLEKDKIVVLTIIPKTYVTPTSLGFDLTQFVRSDGPKDMPGIHWFTSKTQGAFLSIDSNSTYGPNAVSRLMLQPKESHSGLLCK